MNKKIEINLLIFAIVLFFQRMAFPYTNYIFIPYSIILTCYFALQFLKHENKSLIIRNFIKVFLHFILIAGFILISFVFSKDHNILILKDIIHAAILFTFLFIGFVVLDNEGDFKKFVYYFNIQVIISSLAISITGLLKFLIVLSGTDLSSKDIPLFNSSLSNDYNFYCLSGILGIISILYLLFTSKKTKKPNYILQIFLFILSLNVIFSSSRRGFIFYMIFFTFIVFLNLYILAKPQLNSLNTRLLLFLNIVFMLILGFYISTYNSKLFFGFKRSSFNVNFITNFFFQSVYRYTSIFNVKRDTVDRIISIKPDPRYPYTRWGTRIHTEVYPIEGRNVEIVPTGTVGYKLDKTCNADSWNGNAFAYTLLSSLFKGDTINEKSIDYFASVYCYVSEDFNGWWVRIAAEGNVSGKLLGIYDMSMKGTWQKLEVHFQCRKGIAPVHLYISKQGEKDFRNLTGYVIFAYPEYGKPKIVKTTNSSIVNLKYARNLSVSSFFDNYPIKILIKRMQYLFINYTASSDTISKDVFRIQSGDEFSVARIERWKYGYYLFTKEYTLSQKLIGDGFNYMTKFGRKFGESKFDYPHNPFIDAFLYSGIVGGIFYIYFMFLVFLNYVRYLKHHLYFFICFIIVFYFSFVSANTHFSVPVFAFFSFVPFITKYIEDNKFKEHVK